MYAIRSYYEPIITIPDLDHPEQENNAKKIADMGCGIALSYRDVDDNLEEAIEKMASTTNYLENSKKLMKFYLKNSGTA